MSYFGLEKENIEKRIMKHDCIIAVHIGHNLIRKKESKENPLLLKDDCCGGIVKFTYCPECGKMVKLI